MALQSRGGRRLIPTRSTRLWRCHATGNRRGYGVVPFCGVDGLALNFSSEAAADSRVSSFSLRASSSSVALARWVSAPISSKATAAYCFVQTFGESSNAVSRGSVSLGYLDFAEHFRGDPRFVVFHQIAEQCLDGGLGLWVELPQRFGRRGSGREFRWLLQHFFDHRRRLGGQRLELAQGDDRILPHRLDSVGQCVDQRIRCRLSNVRPDVPQRRCRVAADRSHSGPQTTDQLAGRRASFGTDSPQRAAGPILGVEIVA